MGSCSESKKETPQQETEVQNSGLSSTQNVSEKGKELYSTHCKSCHGSDGTLGMNGAKNLQVSTLNRDEIIHQVTNGKGMMTAFKSKMSADEIAMVTDYVMMFGKVK